MAPVFGIYFLNEKRLTEFSTGLDALRAAVELYRIDPTIIDKIELYSAAEDQDSIGGDQLRIFIEDIIAAGQDASLILRGWVWYG